MNPAGPEHRSILREIARRSMIEKGLLPDFSPEVTAELSAIKTHAANYGEVRDLTEMPWASIDNDDTRDIDQLTVAQQMSGGSVKIFVAVADVDSMVKNGSAIDDHACRNATSVYTAAQIFPMLPEKLSTDLTSLNLHEDRPAVVCEMEIGPGGALLAADVYNARVNNCAKLAYNSVAMWLDGKENAPPALSSVKGLEQNLRLQDRTAQTMKNFRRSRGALGFETVEARPVFDGNEISDLEIERRNRAKTLIEELMIGANIAVADYLAGRRFPFLRRV
ncbi:MAG TPA: ribonuclease catalytic domain-containing protein, partial [Syntrophales bacterium]|nr:ribonuclease catalytic domain-containing protein [Syntrophales bacterium]